MQCTREKRNRRIEREPRAEGTGPQLNSKIPIPCTMDGWLEGTPFDFCVSSFNFNKKIVFSCCCCFSLFNVQFPKPSSACWLMLTKK